MSFRCQLDNNNFSFDNMFYGNGTALKAAVIEWLANASAAEEKHGHITNWDTSMVRSTDYLFKVRFSDSN